MDGQGHSIETEIHKNTVSMTATLAHITPEPHQPVNLCDITEEMQKLDENTLLFFQGFW